MIHRMDPPADRRRGAHAGGDPADARPARDACPNDDDAYGFEVKWDGVRTVAHVDAGHVTLTGRNGTDFSGRYPEVRALGEALGSRRLVLDGEVVAFDSEGRPSFERLQSRMHLASDSAVRRRMRDIPVAYVIFDLLWLEGHSTLGLAYRDRRTLLGRARAGRQELAGARPPRGRRRCPARGDRGSGPRRGRGKAAGFALRARPAVVGLDQGQEPAVAGGCRGRMAAGRGQARGHARRAHGRSTRRRPAGLRRPGRVGVHRGDARDHDARARATAHLETRRSMAVSHPRARFSWSRDSWRRWSSRSGPPPEHCARPRSRACARMPIRSPSSGRADATPLASGCPRRLDGYRWGSWHAPSGAGRSHSAS